MTARPVLLLAAALAGCAGPGRRDARAPAATPPGRVMTGLDVLAAEGFARLRGRRVGVITNRTGVDAAGRSVVELLGAVPDLELRAVFTPEHGFNAVSEADRIASDRIRVAGRELPLYSLYAGGPSGQRPTSGQLHGIDVLVFDIQDIGARFYTYLATMGMALEVAQQEGVEFMVLDRPNPIGGLAVEGPALDEPGLAGQSLVAYYPVPVRHGLTAGEIARLHNRRVGHKRLAVVALRGWRRALWHDETGLPWVPPSPNMPDLDAAALYPGVACLEYSNVSVGRGTPSPFGWVGAPWLDAEAVARRLREARLPGLEISVEARTPGKSLYEGKPCPGVRLKVLDRRALRPFAVFAHLVCALRDLHPKDYDLRWKESRKLIGRAAFLEMYERGDGPEQFIRLFETDAAAFAAGRDSLLIYR